MDHRLKSLKGGKKEQLDPLASVKRYLNKPMHDVTIGDSFIHIACGTAISIVIAQSVHGYFAMITNALRKANDVPKP